MPDYSVFLHGHKSRDGAGWHSLPPAVELATIRQAMLEGDLDYASLNKALVYGHLPMDLGALRIFYALSGLSKALPPLPPRRECFLFMCCAQFVASRRAIRAHPRSLYHALAEIEARTAPLALSSGGFTTLEGTTIDGAKAVGVLLEYTWHAIFGRPWLDGQPVAGARGALSAHNHTLAFPSECGRYMHLNASLADTPLARPGDPDAPLGVGLPGHWRMFKNRLFRRD